MLNSKIARKRVLIIDDEPQIARIFGLKLKLAGFEVTSTTSGADGIELIRKQCPDVVLLDIRMPVVTGFNVLDEVRKFSKVPIIIFTARPETIKMAVRLGADDFIIKPADPELVVGKVKEILFDHHDNLVQVNDLNRVPPPLL